MSKPIFIVKIPQETYEDHRDHVSEIINGLERKLDDYHVLVMWDNRTDEIRFECFNSNDIGDIEFAELKEMILESIKVNNNE